MAEKLIDYISGIEVPSTPEELHATQPFSKMLVEDYGYPKNYIQTRPQARVKSSPSDKKGYPVDIAVYKDSSSGRKLFMIVECKKPGIKLADASVRSQLETYLACSGAEIGVLFNGSESLYIHRFNKGLGNMFVEIPAIPKHGEKLEEIGLYKKETLVPVHNLKSVFKEIRGWIVANGNVTRDDIIASQVILLILCKIHDEKFTALHENLKFRASLTDSDDEIEQRIQSLFLATKSMYYDVISDADTIDFDGKTLRGIIGRLQRFSLLQTDRDCIADAFEVFVDKAVKEDEGQFFTPRNVVRLIIEAVQINRDDKIIDSACGSGGFLVESLKKIESLIDEEGNRCGWSKAAKLEEFKSLAIKNIRGLEKDPFLTKLSKSYMAILGDGKGGIYQEDSLDLPSQWHTKTQSEIRLGFFDKLLANPPFGKNIKVEGKAKLEQYNLARKADSKGKLKLLKTGNVSTLFLERNMQLIKKGGTMGIILPEPYFALPKYRDAIDFMLEGNNIKWIIDLPHDTFRPHNNAKCCAIVIEKGIPQKEHIDMIVIENIGHDHQGKPVYDSQGDIVDDTIQGIEEIRERNVYGELKSPYNRPLSFSVPSSLVSKNKILVPRYYWKSRMQEIQDEALQKNVSLVPLETLVQEKILKVLDGHGSPEAKFKGEGSIPYIRVKDIVNWQPYVDVTSLIPRDEYDRLFDPKKELKPKDILYVSRGSYRIGSVAMISPYDGEMLLTREIKIFRLLKEENKYGITPEYLLYALSHRYTWEQTKSKVFYEPCLPNIADRWKDVMIPIYNDASEFQIVKEKAKQIVEQQWAAKRDIQLLRESNDAFLI